MVGIADFKLEGRVALVTGGTMGIGRGIARAFATAGAKVAVVGHRNMEAGAETVAELEKLGTQACFLACDVRDPRMVDAMIKQIVERFGALHIAVNNAAKPSGAVDIFDERAIEAWPAALASFASAPFWCCRAEGAYMKDHGGGAIINISSAAAHRAAHIKPTAGLLAYYVAKAGLLHMTRVLALEWAQYGIRVNAISPGLVRTPLTQFMQERPELLAKAEARIPLHRIGEPDDIGGAALFLASDAASFTTGAEIVVDGGELVG